MYVRRNLDIFLGKVQCTVFLRVMNEGEENH